MSGSDPGFIYASQRRRRTRLRRWGSCPMKLAGHALLTFWLSGALALIIIGVVAH